MPHRVPDEFELREDGFLLFGREPQPRFGDGVLQAFESLALLGLRVVGQAHHHGMEIWKSAFLLVELECVEIPLEERGNAAQQGSIRMHRAIFDFLQKLRTDFEQNRKPVQRLPNGFALLSNPCAQRRSGCRGRREFRRFHRCAGGGSLKQHGGVAVDDPLPNLAVVPVEERANLLEQVVARGESLFNREVELRVDAQQRGHAFR